MESEKKYFHFADDIFKFIFFYGYCGILIQISLKYIPRGSFNNDLAFVQLVVYCQTGDKPSSEPVMAYVLWRMYASPGLNRLTHCASFICKMNKE